MRPLHELLGAGLDRIEELGQRGSSITGVATGYHELDKILLGFQPSSLNIVGARPGMGKTSFALGVLANVGLQVQRPALLFSLEMGHLELTQRLLASEAEVNGQSLQTGRIRTQDWSKIGMAVTRLSGAPIFIDDNPNVTVMDIRARARRLKKSEGDLGLVVVDYLQLMTGRGRAENRQTEVAEISRGLKILARELEVPVVALSQLSRNLESRQDKTPQLSDLRESGSLEQDADVVLFIYRESEYNDEVPDRPGRRRADRSGQAPERTDRQGQPAVLEAVRPLREPPRRLSGSAPQEDRAAGQHEVLDGVGEALVLVALRRLVRRLLRLGVGVAHGDAEARVVEHQDVVGLVADGGDLLGLELVAAGQVAGDLALVGLWGA